MKAGRFKREGRKVHVSPMRVVVKAVRRTGSKAESPMVIPRGMSWKSLDIFFPGGLSRLPAWAHESIKINVGTQI